MKSLDEVISALSFCSEGLCEYCPYQSRGSLCEDVKCNEALHYLEEYRNLLECNNCKNEIM